MDIERQIPPLNIAGLTPGAIFSVDDKKLVWRGELGDGDLNVQDYRTGELYRPLDASTGMRQVATSTWMQDALARGVFKILLYADGTKPEAERARLSEMNRDELLKYDPQAEARQTLLLELHLKGVSRSDPNLGEAVREIWTEKLTGFGERPATSTVREWMTWTDPSLPALVQLVSNSGRVPRAKRLDPLVREVISRGCDWYWQERGRQIKDAEAKGAVEILKINQERREQGLSPLKQPSREAYRRAVRASESPENYERKYGKIAAQRYWRASREGQQAKHALELVLMDDTILDAVACIRTVNGRRYPAGRPYLCLAICVGTRCVPGFVVSFKPPTTHTAAECLRRVGLEKTNISPEWKRRYPVLTTIGGKPVTLGVDNGSNYISPAFQEAAAEAGITIRYAPIREPKWKAIVERFFRALNTWLLQKLPGHTLDPKTLRELNYDPATKAVLLVEELEALIAEFLNVYHVSIHSTLNEQPAAAWLRSIEARPRAILDQQALDRMLLITVPGRRLTVNGVRWNRRTYRVGELERLLRANVPNSAVGDRIKANAACTVKIKIDPNNVGHIWVEDLVTRTYVELRATDARYSWGLSLDQHEQVLAWAKKQNLAFNTEEERLAALNGLNDFIEATIPALSVRERRAVGRFTDPAGTPTPDHDVIIGHAAASHDGLGKVIEHDPAAPERLDHDVVQDRPASGVTSQGSSHDADPREDLELPPIDPATGLFTATDDEDDRFEEDYS